MANWYYDDLGDEVGPVSPAEMRQRVADGTIDAATRVRREDGDWTTADRVPGLLDQARVLDRRNEGDGTGGIIPYKNAHALIAYYLGIFSLAPCVLGLGAVLGLPAIVLGVMGLRNRRANPLVKGSAHAWIGIILGGITTLISVAAVATAIVGIAGSRR